MKVTMTTATTVVNKLGDAIFIFIHFFGFVCLLIVSFRVVYGLLFSHQFNGLFSFFYDFGGFFFRNVQEVFL